MIYQHVTQLIPQSDAIDAGQVLTSTLGFAAAEPWLVLVLIEALGLIWGFFLWGQNEQPIGEDKVKAIDIRAQNTRTEKEHGPMEDCS
jgi:hypothetical protein